MNLHPPATPTYCQEPTPPRLVLPPGACDTHVHVFGPASRFPLAVSGQAAPADAPKETLYALHRHLGIQRCVIVQSAVHGLDNAVTEDAIAHGEGRYLGVALVPLSVDDAELARLARVGFRGVRFNFMKHLAPAGGIDEIVAFTRRLAPLGMHLQVHFESALIHHLAGPLAQSAVPVVIDHMGRVDASLGPEHADFAALRQLMRNPLFRVKVSGIDRVSPFALGQAAPDYASGIALARVLVREFPERCLWGSDWPHPNHTHVPDDGALVDALTQIAPDARTREQLLVRNPLEFYRFEI
ncbi:amidohydrolase family protein [Hydrogenophaga sp. BPS33]|uniref:amidohydrolase family protein n=1 Tax=Hydrogenophaga sp. BPS33 TaxID=2651974 RepID=UPI00131F6773|nr:amidohydrolase family protein [Hydrogenophaga sp. BPS33]QHE84323.1 amidohydrolase family protein [Hydrogenophaga sp. BPS33]